MLAKEHALSDLYVTHRLDRLTSGVVIFAKNSSKADDIRKAIEQHSPLKIYLGGCGACGVCAGCSCCGSGNAEFAAILNASFSAVVRGCPSWDVNVIDADLACDDKRMVQYRFVASGLCWI